LVSWCLAGSIVLAQQKYREFHSQPPPQGVFQPLNSTGAYHNGEYFAGKRWLPDDNVTGVWVASPREVWFRTPAGYSRIEYRPTTLEQKAAYFEKRLQERHDRDGFIGSTELTTPGDLATSRKFPHDNDGLWTAIYVGAQAFRYAATKDPEAKARARRSMEAMMRLEQVSGISGFPARAMIRRGEFRHPGGVWHASNDGAHEWKADTSSDELVGHFYAYAVYYDFVAEEAEKPALRAAVDRIMTHLLEHEYNLVDWTGRPTTWARYHPDYVKNQPDELALNSMLLLSHLLVAHHMTGQQRFRDEYHKLIREHRYHINTTHYLDTRQELNYSDEEMAMLGYYPLFRYEKDPELRRVYRQGLEQWWANIQREKNPLWIYIYNFCTAQRARLDEAEWTLTRIPMDLVTWTVTNSHRADIQWEPDPDRFGARQAKTLLPPDERPVMKWNANPFRVDGGNGGRGEDDGAFYLLPYWMGRYHGYLK
jgi:hypothetical protein